MAPPTAFPHQQRPSPYDTSSLDTSSLEDNARSHSRAYSPAAGTQSQYSQAYVNERALRQLSPAYEIGYHPSRPSPSPYQHAHAHNNSSYASRLPPYNSIPRYAASPAPSDHFMAPTRPPTASGSGNSNTIAITTSATPPSANQSISLRLANSLQTLVSLLEKQNAKLDRNDTTNKSILEALQEVKADTTESSKFIKQVANERSSTSEGIEALSKSMSEKLAKITESTSKAVQKELSRALEKDLSTLRKEAAELGKTSKKLLSNDTTEKLADLAKQQTLLMQALMTNAEATTLRTEEAVQNITDHQLDLLHRLTDQFRSVTASISTSSHATRQLIEQNSTRQDEVSRQGNARLVSLMQELSSMLKEHPPIAQAAALPQGGVMLPTPPPTQPSQALSVHRVPAIQADTRQHSDNFQQENSNSPMLFPDALADASQDESSPWPAGWSHFALAQPQQAHAYQPAVGTLHVSHAAPTSNANERQPSAARAVIAATDALPTNAPATPPASSPLRSPTKFASRVGSTSTRPRKPLKPLRSIISRRRIIEQSDDEQQQPDEGANNDGEDDDEDEEMEEDDAALEIVAVRAASPVPVSDRFAMAQQKVEAWRYHSAGGHIPAVPHSTSSTTTSRQAAVNPINNGANASIRRTLSPARRSASTNRTSPSKRRKIT